MGNRLSKIVTRTGDQGTTGLTDGRRIEKHHLRVCAMGDVDELNSQIGVVLTHDLPQAIAQRLHRLQQVLFNLGGELSMPGTDLVTEEALAELDSDLAALNEALPPLKDFIMPGGSPAVAAAHVARAVARRAERSLWALNAQASINPNGVKLLNRLSDYLFVVCRTLAKEEGDCEVTWDHERQKP